MGLFNSQKEKRAYSTVDILNKYEARKLKEKDFIAMFANADVFYSTPFGDCNDGSQKLFLLPGPNKTGYQPVFSSQEHLMKFYEKAGRKGYVIMNGTFLSVLETAKKTNEESPVKMGLIIEPGYNGITVDADKIDVVINMSKK